MKAQKTIVISLGGSVICPEAGKIDVNFLRKFKSLILKFLKRGYRFIIVAGGGKTCRLYLGAAKAITEISNEDGDWLGIAATRLNAQLLKTIFRGIAESGILDNPHKFVKNHWKILIGAGWKPGWSTDYDSVLFAKRFGAREIINASNMSHVYTKDFRKYKSAKPIKKISWNDYQKIVGKKWNPGLSTPFDPIASRAARKLKIRTFIIKGTNLKNFENLLSGKKFEGTTIGP